MVFIAGQVADSEAGSSATSGTPLPAREGGAAQEHPSNSEEGLLELLTQLANFGLNAGAPPVLGTAEPS
jgi:hypothetical protein